MKMSYWKKKNLMTLSNIGFKTQTTTYNVKEWIAFVSKFQPGNLCEVFYFAYYWTEIWEVCAVTREDKETYCSLPNHTFLFCCQVCLPCTDLHNLSDLAAVRTHSLDFPQTGPLDGCHHIWSFLKISVGSSHQTTNQKDIVNLSGQLDIYIQGIM